MNSPQAPKDAVTEVLDDIVCRQPVESRITLQALPEALTLTFSAAPYGSSYVVRVFADELVISWLYPRRPEAQRWHRRQIADVRLTPDANGDGPLSYLVEIHPHPGEGKMVSLPIWDEAEARWVIAVLRHALQIPTLAPGELPPFLERDEQPAGGQIVCERSAGGVTLTVPPAGWRHPNVRNLFLQALWALAFAVLGGAGFWWLGGLNPEDPSQYFMFRCIAGGWAVAWGWLTPLALLRVVYRARRHAVLTVEGDTLLVVHTSLLGVRRRQWPRSNVADVRIALAHDGFDDSICDLRIHLHKGKIVRMLAGYGDPELQWLATVVRRALRVPQAALPQQDPVRSLAPRRG
jgi:hypothetical protein